MDVEKLSRKLTQNKQEPVNPRYHYTLSCLGLLSIQRTEAAAHPGSLPSNFTRPEVPEGWVGGQAGRPEATGENNININ